jgi:predicted nuclease of predicted toxin-antitoxin system
MDENVDDAITNGLRQRGVDVLTVQENGQRATDDSIILDTALTLGRVMFTCDDDFLAEGHRRQALGQPFAGVIYIHQEDAVVGYCVRELETLAKAGNPGDLDGQVVYL